MDLKTAELYVQLRSYKALVEKTNAFISESLEKVKNPYVACSFGKDSSVMLDLIIKHNKNIPVVFVSRPETNLIDNYNSIIKEWNLENLIILNFEENTLNFISKSVIKTAVKSIQNEYDSYFVGLRAQENKGRAKSLKIHGLYFLNKSNITRICPIGFWTEKDIAAYCLVNNIPTLNTYKIEGFSARTTAGISSKTPEKSLQSLKYRDIDSFNKLLELYPDIKEYI